MLNGAVEIIGGAPARHIHPIHLARSQPADVSGYILISYAQELSMPEYAVRKFLDLFFFRGPVILETVRFTRDLRFALPPEAAHRTFEAFRHHPATLVSFYQAEVHPLELLRTTCHLMPSLKLHSGELGPEQVQRQLLSCPCRHGILEWSDLEGESPAILLEEVRSGNELACFTPPHEGGKILVYDLEENREYLRHTHGRRAPAEVPAPPAAAEPPRQEPASAQPSEVVRAADRLVRTFRQRAFELLGPKAETLLSRAEGEIRFLSPGFDASSLADDSAALVFDFIERIVGVAPFWRRGPLRKVAESLLADFYAKQYDLLERTGLLDIVEQTYYKVKR